MPAIAAHRRAVPNRLSSSAPLEEALLALLVADRRVSAMGPAPYADVVLGVSGLGRLGVVACEAFAVGRRLLLLAVPSRAWRVPETKADVLRMARTLEMRDLRVVLVPEGVIRREPRLSNARLISACSHVVVTPRDRMAVMSKVLEQAGCPLSDCAAVVRAPDRYGVVLSMVAEGLLACAMDMPLLPWTEVCQPAARSIR